MCAFYGPRKFYARVTIETKLANDLNRFQRFGLLRWRKRKKERSKRRPERTRGLMAVYPDDREEANGPRRKDYAGNPWVVNACGSVSLPDKISHLIELCSIGSADQNRVRL